MDLVGELNKGQGNLPMNVDAIVAPPYVYISQVADSLNPRYGELRVGSSCAGGPGSAASHRPELAGFQPRRISLVAGRTSFAWISPLGCPLRCFYASAVELPDALAWSLLRLKANLDVSSACAAAAISAQNVREAGNGAFTGEA